MSGQALIDDSVRALCAAGPALLRLIEGGAHAEAAARAAQLGYFRPRDDGEVLGWFARYLTARGALVELIDDLRPLALGGSRALAADEATRLRAFVLAYTAACLLVKSARYLVGEYGMSKLVQRKLNEGSPTWRIPRKQYTATYRSLTRPANAWRLARAMRFAEERAASIDALRAEPGLGEVIEHLRASEDALRLSAGRYVTARLRYRWHAWRRRRASAVQQGLFLVFEAFGRVIADVRAPFHRDRVRRRTRAAIARLLRPGDVMILRHDRALSNLFLPGYWPHAALYIGEAAGRDVLEARKDGVRCRALDDTLAVDAVAILRPALGGADVERAIARALEHEGKLYDFDFDFFRSDRLVCTEVVYRAYDGLGGCEIPLRRRGGRPTLSAEDLLRLALAGPLFQPLAVFGTPHSRHRLVTGPDARPLIAASLSER